ncbi:MAG: hypothetical protein CML43_01035, partial [Rhodobacteraceae bacterium]|nr:hypothetical protein [Paracoccaceae bacterium]
MISDEAATVTEADMEQVRAVLLWAPHDADAEDAAGWTPLHRLLRFGEGPNMAECVKLFVTTRPSTAVKETPEGQQPLQLAVQC